MNERLSRCSLVAAVAVALAACTGAPTTQFETDAPDFETPFDDPGDTPFDESEETPPVEDPGYSFAVDPSTYDDGFGWAVQPTAVLSGTGNLGLDGSYSVSATARICGLSQSDLFGGNPNGFSFGFPLGPGYELDVTFRADDLAPGTSTTAFDVSVAVVTGGSPIARDLGFPITSHPEQNSGVAQLTHANGHRILDVEASNDLGNHLTVHADCIPPSGS